MTERVVHQLESVTIRFAGDSGDGMQLTGMQFTAATAAVGNDLATLPDFPAEIRAPAGTLAGVSGFQIQFASDAVYTPGDSPDVLVAMNPAALRANLPELSPSGIVIVNSDSFKPGDLRGMYAVFIPEVQEALRIGQPQLSLDEMVTDDDGRTHRDDGVELAEHAARLGGRIPEPLRRTRRCRAIGGVRQHCADKQQIRTGGHADAECGRHVRLCPGGRLHGHGASGVHGDR